MSVAGIWIKPIKARIILSMLEAQVEVARLQFERIHQDSTKLQEEMRQLAEAERVVGRAERGDSLPDEFETGSDRIGETRSPQTALFADIHFLLICLDKIDLFLRRLEEYLPDVQEFHLVRERHRGSLREYNDFRNHLEHIDDRLEKGVTDLGNLGGTTFSFDDKSFEVGEAQRRKMEEIFNDILWTARTVSVRQSIDNQ